MTKLFNNLEKFKNKTALIDFNAKEYSYNEIDLTFIEPLNSSNLNNWIMSPKHSY